jgi:predicted DNA-binding protein YlxM (UPF0122 family)
VVKYKTFSKTTTTLQLPANLLTKLSKQVGYKKDSIDVQTLKNLYETSNYSKKDLGDKFGCSATTITDILKKEHITNELLNAITYYYINDYSDSEISNKLNISEDRLVFLYKKHAIKTKKKIQERIDIEEFTNLYLDNGYTYAKLAEYYDCSVIVIYSLIKKLKLNRSLKKHVFNEEQLAKLYLEDNLTQTEIAKQFNCCQNTIDRALAEFNIVKTNCYSNRETVIEKTIRVILEQQSIKYLQNTRSVIAPKELDFFLPENNIAIEVCGLYWHSTKVNTNKHHIREKYDICKDAGIRLITIFEDEISLKPAIVKNRLLSALKRSPAPFYARQCVIKQISARQGIDFLNAHHIQGAGHNRFYFGAFYNDALVAVMSFSNPSIAKGKAKAEWELNRFASIDNIPGIASKLFKFFERTYAPKSIISYADLRWNTGNLYIQLNFKQTHTTQPNYWYTTCQKNRKHRFAFTKQRLLELYPNADAAQTEQQIAEQHGLYRIYDCGSAVYKWQPL